MSTLREFEILDTIHHMIKRKRRGTPYELANRLNISRSCLYDYINKLEDYGAEISYSRSSQSFYYKNDFEFKLIIQTGTMNKIFGGKKIFRPIFLDGVRLRLKNQNKIGQ